MIPAVMSILALLKAMGPPPPAQPGSHLPCCGFCVPERNRLFLFAQVDTASEVEELEADNVSQLPVVPESSKGGSRIQVFLARYRWVSALFLIFPAFGTGVKRGVSFEHVGGYDKSS